MGQREPTLPTPRLRLPGSRLTDGEFLLFKPLLSQYFVSSALEKPTQNTSGYSLAKGVAQSCLTLPDSRDCSPPGFAIRGVFQAAILEWVAVSFSKLLSI